MNRFLLTALLLAVIPPSYQSPVDTPPPGYYRFPAIHGDTVVFTAEGDLWVVTTSGGVARRLTTGQGEETNATLSPDGRTVAFLASYEGSNEIYTMPLAGGVPTRRTWGGGTPVGWTPDGKILYASGAFSTLPNARLFTLDLATGARAPVPLAQASDGSYDRAGRTLYFTRFSFQGSHTKRYKGGTAQNLWKFGPSGAEATPLTADFAGTSKTPMWWSGRVYFASDRDGSMNLWSMDPDGHDLRQLTHHQGWDVQSPALAAGKIVYQLGADLRLYDVATSQDRAIPITLTSDFDQLRVRWVSKPLEYTTSTHVSPSGDRVVLTARGQVFVAPVGPGRLVEASRHQGVRYRSARFTPDGKSLTVLSDESGETDWWKLPANGVGSGEQLTSDARVLRWDGVTSPDGKVLAYTDKSQTLWLLDLATKKSTQIEQSADGDLGDLAWSPDSKWLAYTRPTTTFSVIVLYSTASGKSTAVTTTRADSYSPAWSADGKWLYLLSDRTFASLVNSPWGSRAPEPFFDRSTRIYLVPLIKGLRSPFQPKDELPLPAADTGKHDVVVTVDFDGITNRLFEAPISAGNYGRLSAGSDRLFFVSTETSLDATTSLQSLEITNQSPTAKTLVEGIDSYELSGDRKKVLVRKGEGVYVIDASSAALATLDQKVKVDLSSWTFPIDPREEYREMFREAWRLERDYFYDRHMNGVDWPAMRQKYEPLAERVTSRGELSDLLGQMVSELSALHIFVYGGDFRAGPDQIGLGSLAATYARDSAAGGYRVTHIYEHDPDYPQWRSPLAIPGLGVSEGDVIQMVNGVPALSAADFDALLENQTGKQVLLRVKSAATPARDVVVTPIDRGLAAYLRYRAWEYTRRLTVDSASDNSIGYVHLKAMGSGDMSQFEREFYPALNRQGLIIDVRHNGGGNVDSWILEKLMRKAWMYWQPRIGNPSWNMQWAFRGHMVVLTDEGTASDGEAFAEGFRRLGLGKVIGTRTWGGEIWLSSSNVLQDHGIATAAELGVYGPEGAWLIEGHGVDPDTVVDNPPHATYGGADAQLAAAIAYLQREIKAHPVPVPAAPAYPDKSH